MSTALSESTEVKEVVQAPNGAVAAPAPAAIPRFPFFAAPFAAVTASVLATRIIRRRRAQAAAKPSVYWSFSVATGNHVYFRPTLAPRFSGFLFPRRGRGRAPRRLFKR